MPWIQDTRCPYCGHIHEQGYIDSPNRKQIKCLGCHKDFYRSERGNLTFRDMMAPAIGFGVFLLISLVVSILNAIFTN